MPNTRAESTAVKAGKAPASPAPPAESTAPSGRLFETLSGIPVQPRPWRAEGGGFVNPNGFQLFSLGEDGLPNTEDDVVSWK